MNVSNQTAYLAPVGFEHLLKKELKDITAVYGRLMVAKGPPQKVFWWQNIWYEPRILLITSINDAARSLRAIQRNWWPYGFHLHRRMDLIQQKLPFISPKPIDFLGVIPSSPLGSWTLIDESTLFFSAQCQSPFPNGEWIFNEDPINPPSRAYLKLWEFFTRYGVYPSKTDTCLDLGAAPGGWSFVLAGLAKEVIAYDKSPLDDRIMALKNVSFKRADAFKVKLSQHKEVSWVLSDVICYPDKLYQFIAALLAEFPDKNYVFTIKFQGSSHHEVMAQLGTLPGHIVHLSNNKHELTWFKLAKEPF